MDTCEESLCFSCGGDSCMSSHRLGIYISYPTPLRELLQKISLFRLIFHHNHSAALIPIIQYLSPMSPVSTWTAYTRIAKQIYTFKLIFRLCKVPVSYRGFSRSVDLSTVKVKLSTTELET
jgi:hypothetical protein